MAKHKNGKKLDYFEAFEKQAELAIAEAKLLVEVIENYKGPDSLDEYIERAHEIEHAGDKLVHSVFDAVTVDFVTPIDREDIIALTQKLDDVLDYMEGTVQRFYMLDVKEMHPKAGEFAELLLKSCEKLGKALEDLTSSKTRRRSTSSSSMWDRLRKRPTSCSSILCVSCTRMVRKTRCMCLCGISCSSASRTQQMLASRLPIPWAPSS